MDKLTDRNKIVLIGAGSAVFTQGLIADFILSSDMGKWEIGLVDIDKKALNSITLLAKKMVKEKEADIIISSSIDRRDLLPRADVVVTTVAVGGRRAWENDVLIPRKYGIYQPVGDTTMPGGISRALRMIPVMLEISRDIKELCPDAYFFNYSNPMTAIVTAIRKETNIPVVGLCHGLIHTEKYLADFLDADLKNIKSFGIGLNHLTFIYNLSLNGKDAWPLIDKKLEEKGKDPKTPYSWEIYKSYRAFPAVMDRHVVEFYPEEFADGSYYGKTLGKDAFSFEDVIAEGDKTYQKMHEQAVGNKGIDESLFNRSEGEHEQLIEILGSLFNDERKLFYVNLPNKGAVPNLPANAVLEMPAVASNQGFYPLYAEDYPDILAAHVKKRLTVIDLTVEAALKGDRSMVIDAMLFDGAVKNKKMAAELTDELLNAHKEYLPQFL